MKKKYLAGMAVACLLILGFSVPVYADLVVSGTVEYDGAQRNLIYDTDLNITWLDYTKSEGIWNNQQSWAASLSFTINGVTYNNWRLPSTDDALWVDGYDGTTTAGYNITTSEMGHLFYTELGNEGWLNTYGYPQPDSGLINKGPFANLVSSWYWSGTEHVFDPFLLFSWDFNMGTGNQSLADHVNFNFYALAVLPGHIQAVPEPASMLLIGTGLAGLSALRRKK